jgi:3-deoxy-manno-octulosonate cytidylyltransferase (CMP-KDO synthetase)
VCLSDNLDRVSVVCHCPSSARGSRGGSRAGADAAMPICAPSSDSSSSSGSGSRVWVLHGLALGAAAAAAAAAYLYRRPSGFRSRAVGIIPARFASTRFEGKPLVHILGKPMIQVCLLPTLSHRIFQRELGEACGR